MGNDEIAGLPLRHRRPFLLILEFTATECLEVIQTVSLKCLINFMPGLCQQACQ